MLHGVPRALFLTFSLCILIGIGSFPSFAKKPDQGQTIKIALLPILDVFPFYVAEAKGFFLEEGVRAQAIPVASGLSRDQLMQAGEIDAMLNEMATTASYNRDEIRVKILSTARKPFRNYPMFKY